MQSEKFDVVKFISRGSYATVYEIVYPPQGDETAMWPTTMTTKLALKRIYLQNESAVRCALREHRILVRLALAEEQSPFLGTLLQSFRIHGGPAFVLRKGSGFDLQDLIWNVGFLGETDARFYSSEIICGLERLHTMHIVHLDVKPTNMLIADSGHLFITDFDRSYDMTREAEPPKKVDFTGTPLFMAPEIKDQVEITTRADVWSLGVLVAFIMYDCDKVRNWLTSGHLRKGLLSNMSAPLRHFFKACLRRNHIKRLDMHDVKCLEFYKDVNWEAVLACKMVPPYHPSNLKVSAAQEKFKLDPYDPLLLAAAYDKHMPLIDRHLRHIRKKGGVRRLEVVAPNRKQLKSAGLTTSRIDELLADFNFINPHLQLSHEVKETQTGSGNKDASSELKLSESEGCSSLPRRSKRRSRKLSSVVSMYSHL
ncbi:agc family protein kinase [Echinococcus multilocularis]|uniref:Agc family protein kinase n=1 Tax=Echinococcus multilocularis TaxID=6211 RepID=A0A068XT04_ECHMU|nr:agc family protein kinase [Echinococcus multilocularis]